MNSNDTDDIGVVFRKTHGHYTVHANRREIDCELSSLIHKQLIYPIADPTSLRHKVQAVREIEERHRPVLELLADDTLGLPAEAVAVEADCSFEIGYAEGDQRDARLHAAN